jgi:hypothetical protein
LMHVAETFSFIDERDGSALSDHAFLDTMVSHVLHCIRRWHEGHAINYHGFIV